MSKAKTFPTFGDFVAECGRLLAIEFALKPEAVEKLLTNESCRQVLGIAYNIRNSPKNAVSALIHGIAELSLTRFISPPNEVQDANPIILAALAVNSRYASGGFEDASDADRAVLDKLKMSLAANL